MGWKSRALSSLVAVVAGCAPSAGPPGADEAALGAAGAGWEGCPAPARQPVGAGELWLQLGLDNVYCGTTDLAVEEVTSELERKAQLHLVPGDYFLPLTPGEHDVDLASCVRFLDDALAPAGSGRLTVTRSDVLGRERATLAYERAMTSSAGEAYRFHLVIDGYLDQMSNGLLLDGREWPASGPSVQLYLCRGDTCDESDDVRVFDACRYEGLTQEVHRFELEGGSFSVLVEAEGSGASFRGRPVRATGEFLGTSFVVESYWDLVMRQTYWYDSARDFVVRFDPPRGSACGIVIRSAWPYPNADWGSQAYALGCDGELSSRLLYDVDWESLAPPEAESP